MAGVTYPITISKLQFESYCIDLYEAFLDELQKALDSAGLDKSQIHKIFALGAAQNNHKIRQYLKIFFLDSEKIQFVVPTWTRCGDDDRLDANARGKLEMENWEKYEQLHFAATVWFSDSRWKCANFMGKENLLSKIRVELKCPINFTKIQTPTCKHI